MNLFKKIKILSLLFNFIIGNLKINLFKKIPTRIKKHYASHNTNKNS